MHRICSQRVPFAFTTYQHFCIVAVARWRFVVPSVLSRWCDGYSAVCPFHHRLASLISFVGRFTCGHRLVHEKLHRYLHPGRTHSAVCAVFRPSLPVRHCPVPYQHLRPTPSPPPPQTVFLSSFSLQRELSSCLLRSLLFFALCTSNTG